MSGLKELEAELLKKGASKTQLKSDILMRVVAVFAETSPDEAAKWAFKALKDAEERAAEEHRFWNVESSLLANWEARVSEQEKKLMKKEQQLAELEKELTARADDLNQYETPEARDAYRKACWFKDNVKINSKYDNTAFIEQLGAILAGSKPSDTVDEQNP